MDCDQNIEVLLLLYKDGPLKPSFVEFENLLASQEVMAKQIGGITLKGVEEALYVGFYVLKLSL